MTRWPPAFAAATLAYAVWTAAGYFAGPFGPGLWATLQLIVLALIATGSGRVLVRGLGLTDISDSQKTLIGATLGLGLLSLLSLALASVHALRGWVVSGALAGLWLVGFTEMWAVVSSLTSNRNLLGDRPLASAAILSILGLVYWTAWVPPHQYDSLVYHLALPQAYVRAQGLTATAHLLYSHFPQNGEMLFALALLLKSDLLTQLFMWLSTVLSAWWLFELGKREAPLSAVLLSCLLLVTHTSVMLLSATSYVEPLVMLWTTASVLSFLRWRQVNAANPRQRSWLVLSAAFTGLALGTKYYCGIIAVCLGAALAARALAGPAEGRRERFGDLALFTAIVSGLFAPWLVKNAVTVGNPVFPFLYKWFPMTGTGWSAATARGYFNALTEYEHSGGYLKDLIQLPYLLLTDSLRFGRGMDILGGMGWELVVWLLPLGVWAGWKNKFLRELMLFCACYGAFWYATGVVLRFLVALAPLLCLLAGCGAYGLWGLLNRWGRAALAAAAGLLMLTHVLLFLFVQFGVFKAANVLLGIESRDQFLSRLDYYPCARYAAEHLDKNDRILIVGEQRGYYVEQNHAASTVHGPNPYVAWANEAAGPADLANKLRSEGYQDILFVPRESQRLGASLGSLTEQGASNWAGLEPGFAKTLFSGPACALLAVGEPAAR